jgi:7-cyano-7-deazaguanine reductase
LTRLTDKSDLDTLTVLGHDARPERRLETFPNHHPDREYVVTLSSREFTCLCPVTGQPDFAEITIEYSPRDLVLESKSLKLYLWSFRDERTFHEHLANVVLDDLVEALSPRWCRVKAAFAARGGIPITVEAEHRA